jgi:hypothetical protein
VYDTLEAGFVTTAAVAHTLFGCHLEVAHDGTPTLPHLQQSGGYRHIWINYTGTGSYAKAVTGVGFRPQFVMIFANGGATTPTGHPVVVFDGAPPGTAFGGGLHQLQDDLVASVDADGFTVIKGATNGMNESGVVYTALCVRDDGDGAGGRRFLTGCLVTSAAGRSHTFPVPFTPTLLLIHGYEGSALRQVLKTSDMGATAVPMTNAVRATDIIPSLDVGGFTTGSNSMIATALTASWYACWKVDAGMAAAIQHGVATATAGSRTVTLSGISIFQVFGGALAAANTPAWRQLGLHTGSDASLWTQAASGTTTLAINALSATAFTLPAGSVITASSDGAWVAFAETANIPDDPIVIDPDDIPVGLVWVEAYLPD